MDKEICRYRCNTSDGSSLDVAEFQYFTTKASNKGLRNYPAARRLQTDEGEFVRFIDTIAFEIIESGELVRRQD